MKTKIWILVALVFSSLGFSVPETRTITGTVTSADDGSTLPGVNVLLKGTATGTVTDGKGKYSIQIPSGSGTLVFSFIGLKPREVKIGTSNEINVSLARDAKILSEVVVTAKGMERKRMSLGYSVSPAPVAEPEMTR